MSQAIQAKEPQLGAPAMVDPPEVTSSKEGRAILERVRIAISEAVYEVVDIGRIRPMPNQPRKLFNPEKLLRLGSSIKQVGQIMPGYLRIIEVDAEGHDRGLVDGERRLRSSLMVGVTTYRAMRIDVDDEAAAYIVSVIANFNREGHTVQELATSIRIMHDKLKISIHEIAESIGYHWVYCTSLYGLRRLVPEVWNMLDTDQDTSKILATAAAIEISRLPQEHQLPLAKRVISREVNLRSLRGEVVSLQKKHGLPMVERVVDPHTQRVAFERKSNVVNRAAIELRERMAGTHHTILDGWSTGNRLAARSEVESARNALNSVLEIIDAVDKRKAAKKR